MAPATHSTWATSAPGGPPPTGPVSIFVRRNGGIGAKYASSAVVTTTVASYGQSATGGTVSSTDPDDITLPSDWASLANNSFVSSTVVEPTVTVAASTTPGYASATITYRGTGTGANGGTLTRDSDLIVDWTVVTTGCDTTPPVITPNLVGTLGDQRLVHVRRRPDLDGGRQRVRDLQLERVRCHQHHR